MTELSAPAFTGLAASRTGHFAMESGLHSGGAQRDENDCLVVGVVFVLLGGLWLLQGLGIVHVRPLLCFADCAPVQGPSPTLATFGAIVLALGVLGISYSRKHRRSG